MTGRVVMMPAGGGMVVVQGPVLRSEIWSTGCTEICLPDCGICCQHFFCSPCQFGSIAESLPRGSAVCAGNCIGAGTLYGVLAAPVYAGAVLGSFFFGLGCALAGATGVATFCYHGHMRRAFRRHFGIADEPGCTSNDYCVTLFCDLCALCQETRELEIRRRNLVYAALAGATSLHPPGAVQMAAYPSAPGMGSIPPFAMGQPMPGPAPMHYATVGGVPFPPAQGMPYPGVGVAQGQPYPGAGASSSSAGGGGESIEQFCARLGLPPSVAGQLREVAVNSPADLASLDERRLDSAGLKPAFKAVILRNIPR